MPIELGQVGWADGSTVDLGDSTNDGNTLVHVTLFAGRDASKPLDQTQAQGQEILCQLSSQLQLPPKGARVTVAIPDHFGTVPGAAMIIGVATNNWQALGNLQPGEQVWQVPGCPIQMGFRQNGTFYIKTTDSNNNDTIFTIAPNAITFTSQAVKMVGDQYGWRHYHLPSGAWYGIVQTTPLPSPLGSISSYFKAHAGQCKLDGASVLIGPDTPATVWNAAVWGLDPSPGPVFTNGVTSASVKIAL